MSKNKKQIYIAVLVAVVFGGLAVYFAFPPLLNQGGVRGGNSASEKITKLTTPSQPAVEPPLLQQGGEESATTPSIPLLGKGGEENTQGSVSVSAGNTTIHLEPNQIFYDALVQAKNAGKLEFSGKNYPGLGFFVTDIGTLHSGNGKSLIYYINGKESAVGVSSYTLKDGDIIEWKLE